MNGMRRLAPDDFHHVAILERAAQRLDLAIDLGTDTCVAHCRVDRIGKVERHGARRQDDQLALRGKRENVLAIHFQLGMLHKLARIATILKEFCKRLEIG